MSTTLGPAICGTFPQATRTPFKLWRTAARFSSSSTMGASVARDETWLTIASTFSDDDTFLITDWLAHTPKEVIAKNFKLPMSDFDNLPKSELYGMSRRPTLMRADRSVFPGMAPNASLSSPSQNVSDPNGEIPQAFSYHFSQQQAMQVEGGSVKIVDTRQFPVSKTIAAAQVVINPGAMREMHWHPTSDEWNIFLQGKARITVFAAEG